MITIGFEKGDRYFDPLIFLLGWEHLTYAMSINTYRCQQLENLQLDHKEK